MLVPQSQVIEKTVIGKRGNSKVFLINTVGGLSMCVLASATPEILSLSPHPAVSKHIARKKYPDIKMDIQKSEEIPLDAFEHIIKKYEAVSDAIAELQSKSSK